MEAKEVQKDVTKPKPVYDLESRTFIFARDVRVFVTRIPRTVGNLEDGKQVIRSSGSIGANYIEATDNLGKKDEVHKIKISRKEARESKYWLLLVDTGKNSALETERERLAQEARELMLIFSAIMRKLT
ncbi:MAG: four helix bundle protein [bacterium]|nr:four helix bundle protein [bacterium]